MIDITLVITALKELGILNLAIIMALINSPSIIFTLIQSAKSKSKNYDTFLRKDDYDKDVKSLYRDILHPLKESVESIRKSVNDLDKLIVAVKATLEAKLNIKE